MLPLFLLIGQPIRVDFRHETYPSIGHKVNVAQDINPIDALFTVWLCIFFGVAKNKCIYFMCLNSKWAKQHRVEWGYLHRWAAYWWIILASRSCSQRACSSSRTIQPHAVMKNAAIRGDVWRLTIGARLLVLPSNCSLSTWYLCPHLPCLQISVHPSPWLYLVQLCIRQKCYQSQTHLFTECIKIGSWDCYYVTDAQLIISTINQTVTIWPEKSPNATDVKLPPVEILHVWQILIPCHELRNMIW